MKAQIRVIGIDDAPFDKKDAGKPVTVVSPIFRAGDYMDKLLSTAVTIDGMDATKNLIKMLRKSKSSHQLKAIFLDGIALGGFNVIDIQELYKKTKIPVIVVMRKRPNMKAIASALKNLPKPKERLRLLERAGPLIRHHVSHRELGRRNKYIYFQAAGIKPEDAKRILRLTTRHGMLPEPIRTAHIIAQGLKLGESKGRA